MPQFNDDADEVLNRFREESLTTLSSYIVSQINSSYDNVLAAVEPLGGGGSVYGTRTTILIGSNFFLPMHVSMATSKKISRIFFS